MRERERALQLVRTLLRPVARVCIGNAISVRDLLELAKQELIQAAMDEREKRGERVNTSRISVMTGIQRKDIVRIQKSGYEPPKESNTIAARVIAQWEQDPRFVTKAGRPKVLTIDGEQNEFRTLVEEISKDLNFGTLARELERIGAIERTAKGARLVKATQVMQAGDDRGYDLLAADVEDLSLSVEENIMERSDVPQLHARTEYDNLIIEHLHELKGWILQQGAAFHERVRNHLARFDKDVHPELDGTGGGRLVVGTYSRASFTGEGGHAAQDHN